MQLNITGHHIELTEALRGFIQQKLARLTRHYDNIANVQVTLSVEKGRKQAACLLNVAGKDLHGADERGDMYAAIDSLINKMDRQLVKYKEKVQAHSKGVGSLGL